MRMHVLTEVATATLAAMMGAAAAQQPTQAQASAIRQSCRADYQSHCADIPTGGSAALQCLQQNAPALSAPCQSALAALGAGTAPQPASPAPMSRRQAMAALRAECGPDYRRLCPNVQPGGGRAISCLQEHASQLSRQCRATLQAARPQP